VDRLNRIPEPVNDVAPHVVEVSKGQEALSIQTRDLASANNDVKALLSGLLEQLTAMMEPLCTMLADLISTTASMFGKDQPSSEDLLCFGSTVEGLSTGQRMLQVISRLTDLPDSMATIVKATQVAQAELLSHAVTKKTLRKYPV